MCGSVLSSRRGTVDRSGRVRWRCELGPQVLRCVRTVRAPALGDALGARRSAVAAESLEAVPDTEVGGHERVRVAERAHRDVCDRPRPNSRRARATAARSRPALMTPVSRTTSPPASAVASPISARRRDQGIASRSGSARARAAADGNRCVTDPTGCSSGSPYALTSRAASVAAPASETCCPSTARIASSSGSATPGTRRPGALPNDLPDQLVGAQRVDDRLRLGVEVEQAPARRTAASRSSGSLSQSSCFDVLAVAGAQRDDARPARQADAAEIDVAVDLFDAGNGAGGEEPHEAGDVARRWVGQPKLDRAPSIRQSRKIRMISSRSSPGASLIALG